MLGRHSSIVIPANTPYAKEMRRHEATHTEFGQGERPFVYREFPKMLYKAVRQEKGGVTYEGFQVGDAEEQRNMQSRGYSATLELAHAALLKEQTEHGKLAAERNYEIAHGRISEAAAAEVRAAEAEHGARHLPEVAEKPRRRRGPNKPKPAVEG
jgi:hypothetical protein